VSTYFRLHPEDEEPEGCLDPEKQVSEPWGGADLGPCDKCEASGRLESYGECPACKGTGQITETERRGVSVFRDADTLYGYMLRRGNDMQDSQLLELEGRESDEPDWDADEGALLVFPTRIVRVVDIDRHRVDELRPSKA
jgi:hypothetical protein